MSTHETWHDPDSLATPGVMTAHALRRQIADATGFDHPGVSVSIDLLATPDASLRVTLPAEPSAQQTAAIAAAIAAHDGPGTVDVDADAAIIVPRHTMDPNPDNNVWADVEGATVDVSEGRRVTGVVDVHASVGTTEEPCGQPLHFTATRIAGGSVKVSESGDSHGAVNGFKCELTSDGPGRLKLRVRRKQTPAIKIDAKITRATVII